MMTQKTNNVVWQVTQVAAADRQRVLGQRGAVLWLTGLSGSGKSTIASALEATLLQQGHAAYVLDGDNIRHGLNADLGFSPEARTENIRRIAEVAGLFAEAGLMTITAFISPYRADRDRARGIINSSRGSTAGDRFIEVYVNTPIEVCEARDPKSLYAKARAGEIPDFTGISAPFEAPEAPELELHPHEASVEQCVTTIINRLQAGGFIPSPARTT